MLYLLHRIGEGPAYTLGAKPPARIEDIPGPGDYNVPRAISTGALCVKQIGAVHGLGLPLLGSAWRTVLTPVAATVVHGSSPQATSAYPVSRFVKMMCAEQWCAWAGTQGQL